MAAGFGALRDDDVGAVLLQPDRLLHDGRATTITRQPAALTRFSSACVRQAEMEADDFGLQLLDEFAHRGVERRAIGGVDRRGGIDPQLLIVGRKPLLPCRLRSGVGSTGL